MTPARRWRRSTGSTWTAISTYHSTRGELLRRLGRDDEARVAYRRALELATSPPEQRFLRRRLDQI